MENQNMVCPNRARNLKKTVTLIVIVLLFGSAVLSARKLDQFVEVACGTGNVGFEAGFYVSSSLEWNRTYGGIGSDFALALVQTVDGGYALAGNTASFGAGSIDVWLVRTDVFGNMLWNRTYGGAGEDRPLALVQTVDGGYALAGRTASFGAGSGDFWLVKTDASGNHLWNRTYGGAGEDRAYGLVQTVDGGYALAGSTASFGAGTYDFWLVKTDASGNHLWNKTYGGASYDDPLAFVQTVDGGYALAGRTYSFGAGNFDFWLVKTDSSGNMLWNRTYGGAGEDRAYGLVQTVDGGYALTGATYSFGAGNGDVWLIRTDAFGNHLWNKTYGGAGEDWPYALIETTNEEYALAGVTNSFGAGSSDFWLVKTDAFGNHLWNRTYGGTGEDYAGSMVQTSDAGYALAGGTKSFGAGSDDFWLVKTVREASTIIVPDDYSAIQEAINNAADGDTIFVKAGTYYEHVVVNKSLSIFGENKENTLIDGNKTGPVILVAANGVNLTEFTIRAGQNSHPICNVWLENVSKCSIHGNILKYSFYGVYLDESNGNSVYENFATNVSIGICGFRSDWNSVFRNEFVANSFAGINFHLCSFNNVTQNLISGNSVGMRLLDGANNNIIHHNNFVNNAVQVYVQSSYNNIWDDGYPSGGNYWSGYGGLDQYNGPYQNMTSSDCIGDTPYVINANNRDNYPLMDPWNPNAGIWTVDDDGSADFSAIQEAIDAASDGNIICVKTGTYYEHVVVNKTVTLLGEDVSTTIVDGNGTGNVFTLDRNDVNIAGLTVQNSGGVLGNAGLRLDNVSFCSISGNRIRNNFAGIWFEDSSKNLITANEIAANVDDGIVFNHSHNNTISENQITHHGYFGIVINWSHNNTISCNNVTQTLGPSHGDGINLWRSSYNNIFQNRVEENNRYGIRIEAQSNNNTLSDNRIRNCTTGLQVYDSSNFNLVYENHITECIDGIDVKNSAYTEIFNNTVAHNYGSDWNAGVRLESASYTAIRNNEIFDNWRGILLYASSPYVSIYGNNVTSNEYGIRVAKGGSSYVNVTGNYVANNRGYGIDVTGFGGGGESNYATIARNLIVNNTFEAVGLGEGSNYNTVIQNNMTQNGHAGVTLERYSNYNTVVQNNMIENAYGICFDIFTVNSTHNMIANNNIISNTQQVRIVPGSVNAWNGIYASGGNYWSDYNGLDQLSGPYQNLTGSDGIGDTPFVIDENNIDRYPLTMPWTAESSLIGDVNSDGRVDMKDVGYVSRRFMCAPSDPLWDANADFNDDGKINMVDIGTVARHFGESRS